MALVDNKAKIQALLNGINALPEAGGGSGGVKTCTFHIDHGGLAGAIMYHEYIDNVLVPRVIVPDWDESAVDINTVVGHTVFFNTGDDDMFDEGTYENCELIISTEYSNAGIYAVAVRVDGDATMVL